MKSKVNRKESRIIMRLSATEKLKFEIRAKEKGIGLSELIRDALQNMKLKDYSPQQKIGQLMETMTFKINLHGFRINQATVALHQLRITGLPESGEVKAFNEVFEVYIQMMEEYKKELERMM